MLHFMTFHNASMYVKCLQKLVMFMDPCRAPKILGQKGKAATKVRLRATNISNRFRKVNVKNPYQILSLTDFLGEL